MDEAEWIAEFRFQKSDIPTLVEVLGIPEYFKCRQGTLFSDLEGLCLLLSRLAYPCRFSDLIPRFGRSTPELSMISNRMVDFMFDSHGHRLTNWNNSLLNPPALQRYADAISNKGAASANCFGFIDGTVRPICRPGINQRVVYNGHKRVHALKFQSVTLPSGMIANMYGPVSKNWSNFCNLFWCWVTITSHSLLMPERRWVLNLRWFFIIFWGVELLIGSWWSRVGKVIVGRWRNPH